MLTSRKARASLVLAVLTLVPTLVVGLGHYLAEGTDTPWWKASLLVVVFSLPLGGLTLFLYVVARGLINWVNEGE